ncbi:hypothetical protein D9756_004665 [Leucocoprinus leucothites]|uniref:Nephrocystin 3-like N-terminal domain-containing protein n=1 Tax=Leucocoprinus leucothites TaxID=201217 RepID=A0A8H5G9U2_9AGAR|nr:hypothetical protein D9756_004665 [Leucoagaricus leucothites]
MAIPTGRALPCISQAVFRTSSSFPLSPHLVQAIMPTSHNIHDFVINGLTNNNININSSIGIDILLEASTREAAVDAGERDYDATCYPGTREQYIKDITSWATTSDSNQLPMYWMKGPAGVGKSAIAQTCARAMKDSGHLGAAFFFSVNGRQKDHTRFFPTLAYQLTTTLPEFREVVNHRVLNDKTLVKKAMSSQFESLIVEPLRRLREQGREVRRRPIFIDGLDECESQDAQAEIIKLIAASVQAKSTPFCWAIFSRAEPCIPSTFALAHISSLCHIVYLPISRETDKEVELYLCGGFKNMLQRRNMVLSSPWPAEEDIKKLVDAAAGLFAYAATVLRFIDKHSHAGFGETLQAVLDIIAKPGSRALPVFSNLDSLYILILERVPDDILRPTKVLLAWMNTQGWENRNVDVALVCNFTGISEATFKSICHYLQAVVAYQEPSQSIRVPNRPVNLKQSFYHQSPRLKLDPSLRQQLLKVHGTIAFLHKSFLEFLRDPTRSSAFSPQSLDIRKDLLDHFVNRHAHYASGYDIQSSGLKLASGIASSSTLLSWPQRSEFVDSFLTLYVLHLFSGDSKSLWSLTVSSASARELDHRKSLTAERMILGLGLHNDRGRCLRVIEGTTFRRIPPRGYGDSDLADFQADLKEAEKAKNIKLFHPHAPSVFASVNNLYSQHKLGKRYGLHKIGHGEKSVVLYWEYDTKERSFHEFTTVDYERAMRIYEAEKFKMWDGLWVPPS